MGKRKLLSPDCESESDAVPYSDSDDQSYATSELKTRRKLTSSRQPTKKRTKRDLDAMNDVSSATPPTLASHARSTHTIPGTNAPAIRTALLQWYSTVHTSRNMPWRKQYDPTLGVEERAQRAYEVWVSEIMLQQTQVATVIPYYNRWMEKFPTIRVLADASIDEVNSLWKGLGYYSRASRLLSGAQKAVNQYAGRLPDNAKDMQANIPGIGRYSAGAICSIAYGENVPVLDGNVNRLLSRFLALHAPPKAKTTLDVLWNAASAMVQDLVSEYPGDINQALIELGSTVCKVRDPNCESCPLSTWCSAYAATRIKSSTVRPFLNYLSLSATSQMPQLADMEDLCKICEPLPEGPAVTAYPMRTDKKKAREELDIVNVVEWRCGSNRQFLLVRRPEGGLLAGLDEFPTSPNVAASTSTARQLKIPEEILSTLLHRDVHLQPGSTGVANHSLRISKVQPAGDVVHVFSHIKKTYRVQWVILEGTSEPPRLAEANELPAKTTSAKPAGKGKGKSKKPTNGVLCSTWVPLNEVAAKNCHVSFGASRSSGFASVADLPYAILNLSKSATDAEIHERHRSLSLIFHPDKHRTEESKSLATEKFLEIQKAYEVLSDPFLRVVYDSLGKPRRRWAICFPNLCSGRFPKLEPIFKQVQYDWLQHKAETTISPRGRVLCKVDASALFIPYQGLQEDAWPRRLLNRLEDVRLLSFTLRHDMEKRITERSTASLAARISRRGASGRGNFVGTLRHQYSPRLAFQVSIWFFTGKSRLFSGLALQATSALLYPYEISLRSEYNNGHDALSLQTVLTPGNLAHPPISISLSRKLFRRPYSLQGRLIIDLGRHPQVAVSVVSQDPLELLSNKPHDHSFVSVLPLSRTVTSWSNGFVLNPLDPKIFGDWSLTFTKLSLQCKLGLECGLGGLAWLFSGSWASRDASVGAKIRLSHSGVVLTIHAEYLQQMLSVPILLSEQHNSSIALWATAVPSAIGVSLYHLRVRELRLRRLRSIHCALRDLKPNSPSRRDAEAVILILKDRARDSLKAESSDSRRRKGLVIVEATYGAMRTADRELGLSWNVTIPIQALVRGSQLHIPGRHPKPSIQGFLDPAPFALKSLQVRYLFRGRMHYTEVPDRLSLVLPLSGVNPSPIPVNNG
ncbi:hypothetical protein B0H11DRAFT_1699307 [Mycena galericulata]|nr:hypothetical protein B0H11DRAFT_1699307 [Mycena galericulata]